MKGRSRHGRIPAAAVIAAMLALVAPARADDAAPLLAVVVASDTDTGRVDADIVSLIFKRRKLYWRNGSRIHPVNLPADNALRSRFSEAVLQQSPQSMEDYWNEQYFHGVLPPHVVASESAMLRFVAGTASAIGYLPYCKVDAQLRVVLLIDAQDRVYPADALEQLAPQCGEP